MKLSADLREYIGLLNSRGVEFLMKNKLASGRPQDLADAARLQEIENS